MHYESFATAIALPNTEANRFTQFSSTYLFPVGDDLRFCGG